MVRTCMCENKRHFRIFTLKYYKLSKKCIIFVQIQYANRIINNIQLQTMLVYYKTHNISVVVVIIIIIKQNNIYTVHIWNGMTYSVYIFILTSTRIEQTPHYAFFVFFSYNISVLLLLLLCCLFFACTNNFYSIFILYFVRTSYTYTTRRSQTYSDKV